MARSPRRFASAGPGDRWPSRRRATGLGFSPTPGSERGDMRRLASLVLASFVGALLPVAAPPAAVAFALPSEFSFEAPPDGPLSRVGTYGYGTAGRFAPDPERPERDGLSGTPDP